MKKLILFFCGILLFPFMPEAQCPTSGFSISGAVCAGEPVNFTNNSSGASSYNWDFCSGDFDSSGTFAIFDTVTGLNLSVPYCATPVIEGGNHYAFICNRGGPSIVRIDFGSSFNNTPIQKTDLGSFGVFSQPSGIVLMKDSGMWHALVTNTDGGQLVKLDFGAGIDSVPTNSTVIVTGLNNPRGIDIAADTTGNIFAAVTNFSGDSITILDFGNSINNTVIFRNTVTIPSCSGPISVSLAHECGHWYAFVCAFYSGGVFRVDFGNSLLNTPVNFPFIISPISNPSGISVVNENAEWIACVVNNANGNMNKYLIGSSLSDSTPSFIGSDFLTSQGPVGIKLIKENSNWFGFSTSVGGDFQRISFVNSCNVNTTVSTSLNPSNIIYNTGGTYYVTLAATDSLGNVSYSSQSITINPLPSSNLSIQNTCFGDVTVFNDSSTISVGNITGRYWDFGDGNSSNLQYATHTYLLKGSYLVTLTDTSNSGCISVDTMTINITSKPFARFTVPSPVCAKTAVQFSDSSTISSGSIAAWHWNFGNDDTSNVSNPLYEYPSGGAFNATLIVTSNSNCVDSSSVSINVNDAPNTSFIATNTCIGGTVTFTDASSINSGSIVAWDWNFGDAQTSTIQNPFHPYLDSIATYNVSLVATSNNGCNDTIIAPVKINNIPVAAFFAPDTICAGDAINLTDLSTLAGDTIYAWHWDFGDSDTAVIKDPIYAYMAQGSYTIVLTVYSQTSCGSSASKTVTVVPSPAAGFNYTTTCIGDSTSFYDTSAPPSGTTIVSRHWDFGDGETSNLINPVHYYDSAGTYSVNLIVTDNIGCTNMFGTPVVVHQLPIAGFISSPGCTSTLLTFLNTSSSSDGGISAYSWNFGDIAAGSSDSSADSEPSHIYYTAGNYSVSLIVTTAFGCSDTVSLIDTINQSSPANFTYLPTCQQEQTIFTNNDSIPSIDSLWTWSFGDGGASYIQSPSHYYLQSGIYDVTLSVTSTSGCVSSITKPVAVSPNPVANFVTAPGCINAPYMFQDISTVSSGSITTWNWTFGNGDTSDVQSPGETYIDTGDYAVTLTVSTGLGCTGSVTNTIRVYPLPTANFSYYPLFGSPPLNINFTDLSDSAAVYLWEFGDGGTSTSASPSHIYEDTGKYNITQIVYSAQGCIDSMSKQIYVITPILDIAVTGVSYQIQNNMFKVRAQVANLGTEDISNYDMQASIQGGAIIDEYVDKPLPSGPQGTITYNFTAAFELSSDQTINYYCISALNPNGQTDDNPANNEMCASLTNSFTVIQPYPNPFTNLLQLQFLIPYAGHVTVELFDNIGQEISVLYDNNANAGGTTFQASTAALENETYFCRFTFQDQTLVYPVVKMARKNSTSASELVPIFQDSQNKDECTCTQFCEAECFVKMLLEN